jgi:hypothetical protein
MKVTKSMFIAALVAGNLFAWNLALRADDSTNTPPANPPASDVKSPARGFDRLSELLNLTADQKPKVQAILKGSMDKRHALREDTSLSADDKKAKAKDIQDDTATQLKAVLTADQFAKWQKMSQHMHHAPPVGENGAGAPPQN